MATLERLEQALVKADAAGDAPAATAFANEIRRMRAEAQPPAAPKPQTNGVMDTLSGVLRGMNRVVGTVGNAITDALPDNPMYRQQRAEFEAFNAGMDEKRGDSLPYKVGDVAGQVLTTLPVGGAVAAPLKAAAPALPRLGPLADAISTSGMRAAGAQGVGGLAARAAGGAVTGGASAALVDPSQAGTGAMIGAATPLVLQGVGRATNAVGRAIRGPDAPPQVRAAAETARNAGYVIPPTQAKPSLVNRALEGMAGKISTAQNASARNQPVTNELAKRAIGANDLTQGGLQAVRQQANQAYDELAQFGAFQADDAYRSALQKAAGSKALPGIVNKDVDDLVGVLGQQQTLDAQQTIESVKRLRFEGSANKSAPDPSKRALGSAQMKIAAALEDLIDRNLQASGRPELLTAYRGARQTLAKTYDVEKALDTATGNVDAKKLAAMLNRGRPLTGELRQVAEFGSQFPKAAQLPERMGSLPGVSPLDFGAFGTISALAGDPTYMAGMLARPISRSAALSAPVQNRLAGASKPSSVRGLLEAMDAGLLGYRAAPLIGLDQ